MTSRFHGNVVQVKKDTNLCEKRVKKVEEYSALLSNWFNNTGHK